MGEHDSSFGDATQLLPSEHLSRGLFAGRQVGRRQRLYSLPPAFGVLFAARPSCADFVFDPIIRGVAPEDAAAVLNASFFTPRLAVGCLRVDWYRLGRWNLIPGELIVRIANYKIAEEQRQASPSSPSFCNKAAYQH